MAKTYLLLFFIIIALPNQLFSQINISGHIINQNNKPVELIEIQLQNKDSVLVKSELTNTEGKFTITIEKGEYLLFVKQLGTVLYKQKISVDQDHYLGEIRIIENQQQLEEVVITTKKKLIERKVDRLIFNVENSISATGGDALDALKVTPGIRVQNEKIAMIGKSGMSVMVDDKLIQLSGDDLINFLKTISSDNIKSIEVITTPPAKYDAEGNSGIVNIKLKKAKKDSWSANLTGSYKQTTYSSGNFGGNFMYQKNRISLLASATYYDSKYIYENRIEYTYPTEFWKNNIDIRNQLKGLVSKLNLEYELSNKSKIGIQYNGSQIRGHTGEEYQSSVYNLDMINLNKLFITNGNTNSTVYNHALNVNFTKKLDTLGKNFAIDVDYFINQKDKKNPFYTNNFDYQIPQENQYYTTNNSLQKIQNFSSKIDFEIPYKWANINFGGKLSLTTNDSNLNGNYYEIISQSNQLYLSQTNIFNYKENNQALYFSFDKKLGKKWTAKAGLRMEATQTKGYTSTLNQENKTNYLKLFPTVYLSHQANENNTFSLSLSRRIERPAYWELDPSKWYTGLNSYVIGNPFMQPSFAYNLEFSHAYKSLLITTLSYSKTENGFGQLTTFDIANDKQVMVRENYYNSNNFTLQENATININKWITSTMGGSVHYATTNTFYATLAPKYKGWGADFNSTQSLILNKQKTFTGEISFNYNFPTYSIIGKSLYNYSLDAGLKYVMLQNKLIVSLNAFNILRSDIIRFRNTSQNIAQSYNQYYDTQSIRLSVFYKFGNKKISVKEREGSNTEEKGRTGS
jgi:hypothetical protein